MGQHVDSINMQAYTKHIRSSADSPTHEQGAFFESWSGYQLS
jgi:hypothetical protein